MRHQSIALIGGSGFIGTHLANALVAAGKGVCIGTRKRSHASHLTMLPLDVIEVDPFDPLQLARFIEGADAVVNLVGTLHGGRGRPYGPEFAKLHVELPSKIAAACEGKGVHRLIHLSAINADSNGPSMYLRSKGDGEKAVLAAARLATTIFRPSVVFGPEDRFLNTFAALARVFPVLPLAKPDAKFQPVYVGDVAAAVARTLGNPAAYGQTYELGGPEVYSFGDLIKYVGREVMTPRPLVYLPTLVARVIGVFGDIAGGLGFPPPLTTDQVLMLKRDYVAQGKGLKDLGIAPTALESIAPSYLWRFRTNGQFAVPVSADV